MRMKENRSIYKCINLITQICALINLIDIVRVFPVRAKLVNVSFLKYWINYGHKFLLTTKVNKLFTA